MLCSMDFLFLVAKYRKNECCSPDLVHFEKIMKQRIGAFMGVGLIVEW